MYDRVQTLLTLLLTVVCAAVGLVLVHREFWGTENRNEAEVAEPPTYVRDWKSIAGAGRLIGDSAAPVKIIEFADLECPVCRRYDSIVQAVSRKYPNDVALVFVHFPLQQHRFARLAAHGAECANRGGRFEPFVAAVYANQDLLGARSWGAYAVDAGIQDTADFRRCMSDSAVVGPIDRGINVGRQLGVHGTPTILVNGWRFSRPPADTTLLRVVHDVLAGHSPIAKRWNLLGQE